MGKQAFVVFEKDQGRWPQAQGQAYPADYNDLAEDKITLACEQVKQVNSSVQCFMYTEVDWGRTQYRLGHTLDDLEASAATPGTFAMICNGTFVTEWDNKTCEGCTPVQEYDYLFHTYDFRNSAVQNLWVDRVVGKMNASDSVVDGAFIDGVCRALSLCMSFAVPLHVVRCPSVRRLSEKTHNSVWCHSQAIAAKAFRAP